MHLDATVRRNLEDLQIERITRQNTELALSAAQERIKTSERTAREYQTTIEKLSCMAESTSSERLKQEQEIQSMNSRIRELQGELRVKEQVEETLLRQNRTTQSKDNRGRRRSSSVTTFKVTALEQELSDLRALNTRQASELTSTNQKLAKAQIALVQMENEKTAMERQMRREVEDMRVSLEEKLEDAKSMGSVWDDAAQRERELLDRLEEEEARVRVLETELQRSGGKQQNEVKLLHQELSMTTDLLESERNKVAEVHASLAQALQETEQVCFDRDSE